MQQERLVTSGKFKDVQRNSITMAGLQEREELVWQALNMMLNNYGLADQVVIASGYVEPKDNIVKAGLRLLGTEKRGQPSGQ